LNCTFLDERNLERMEGFTPAQPLDGRNLLALAGDCKCEAGKNGFIIQENRTGSTRSQITPLLGSGEPKVLPEDL